MRKFLLPIFVILLAVCWLSYASASYNFGETDLMRQLKYIFGTSAQFDGNVSVTKNASITGTLGVTGNTTLTNTTTGKTILNGARATNDSYEYYLDVEGYLTGTGAGAKTYGQYINLVRPAAYNTTVGDLDDAGLKVRVSNLAANNTAGNVLRGLDVQAKNDNPSGTITKIAGAQLSAQTDTGSPPAGNCSVAYGLESSVTGNAAITDDLTVGVFRLFRQSATEPTDERILWLRSSSTTGSGIDSAIDIDSDYSSSATTDSMTNGIDMSGAAVNQANIVLSSGAKIFTGNASTGNGVYAAVGSYDATGSIYLSTGGALFIQVANNGAEADWQKVNSTDAD